MKKALGLALIIAIAVAGGGLWYLRSLSSQGEPGGPVSVAITPGSSGSSIATTLQQQGVVRSAFAFKLYMKTSGINSGLKAGKYRLRANMPFEQIITALEKGPEVEYVKLAIPEGLNLEQTAQKVQQATHIRADDFLAAATVATIRPSILPPGVTSLEGFIYPSTYFVTPKETAESLVRRLVSEFEARASQIDMNKAAALGRTPFEIITIASMIEEEAKADQERPKISAVIHNRLKQSIPLGIDATIQYALRKYNGKELTRTDLEVDSPYNTRKHAGLPPGPISSPRAGSIEAALNPVQAGYLYYVLGPDCVHHVFTASPGEFERAKADQPRTC